MKIFDNLAEFGEAIGTHLGYSEWQVITQDTISRFADATGDHQWIHVDPQRAATGPFGTTVAHGFLTLSLIPALTAKVYAVQGLSMAVNYGIEKARFPAPVPAGSRLRAGVELLSLTPASMGVRGVSRVTVAIEGATKPACVADCVALLVP